MEKQVLKLMKQYVSVNEIVIDKLTQKRDYLLTKNKDKSIEKKHELIKWTTFLPPLIKVSSVPSVA